MTMTRDEIITVLQAAAAYDNRRIDGVMVAAWSESAHRAGWTAAAAVDAVHDHFAFTAGEYLMPGHITERIRAARRHAPPIAEVRELNAAPPASEAKRAAVMEMVRKLADKKAV
ncbi:hypothetical protein GV792_04855 [Nocardia cyriacigeorgica]|uniref:hypothetical protein n=1 Tax=Nocardia cyriacigeorgica TaxID=135487 RepID=UPI0013B7B807|nr:hypothetical protein [Nocardia cyriacigeorgica]NEW49373.1 hypothetical protein [Nocardia cyriacigeorgica]